MRKISSLILFLTFFSFARVYAGDGGAAYYDQKGHYWYQNEDGTLYDNKGHYIYKTDNNYQDVLAGLGVVPAGAHPKTILAGDENQEPGYYQTDPLSNLNRELKKLRQTSEEKKQTVEERILSKIANGEKLTAGEQKIYDEVIKPQPKVANK